MTIVSADHGRLSFDEPPARAVDCASRRGPSRHYEARYRTMGQHLAASLPPDAMIVTAQESGSAHYHTGRPVLRCDLIAVDLESALKLAGPPEGGPREN